MARTRFFSSKSGKPGGEVPTSNIISCGLFGSSLGLLNLPGRGNSSRSDEMRNNDDDNSNFCATSKIEHNIRAFDMDAGLTTTSSRCLIPPTVISDTRAAR